MAKVTNVFTKSTYDFDDVVVGNTEPVMAKDLDNYIVNVDYSDGSSDEESPAEPISVFDKIVKNRNIKEAIENNIGVGGVLEVVEPQPPPISTNDETLVEQQDQQVLLPLDNNEQPLASSSIDQLEIENNVNGNIDQQQPITGFTAEVLPRNMFFANNNNKRTTSDVVDNTDIELAAKKIKKPIRLPTAQPAETSNGAPLASKIGNNINVNLGEVKIADFVSSEQHTGNAALFDVFTQIRTNNGIIKKNMSAASSSSGEDDYESDTSSKLSSPIVSNPKNHIEPKSINKTTYIPPDIFKSLRKDGSLTEPTAIKKSGATPYDLEKVLRSDPKSSITEVLKLIVRTLCPESSLDDDSKTVLSVVMHTTKHVLGMFCGESARHLMTNLNIAIGYAIYFGYGSNLKLIISENINADNVKKNIFAAVTVIILFDDAIKRVINNFGAIDISDNNIRETIYSAPIDLPVEDGLPPTSQQYVANTNTHEINNHHVQHRINTQWTPSSSHGIQMSGDYPEYSVVKKIKKNTN